MRPTLPLLLALDQDQPIDNWGDIATWDYNTLAQLNTERLNTMSKRYQEYKNLPQLLEKVIQRHNSFMGLLAVEVIKQHDSDFLHTLLLNTHNIFWPARNFGWMSYAQCLANPHLFDFDTDAYEMLFDPALERVMSDMVNNGFLPAVVDRLGQQHPACLERLAQSDFFSGERLDDMGEALLSKERPPELLKVLKAYPVVLDTLARFVQRHQDDASSEREHRMVTKLMTHPTWAEVSGLVFNHSLKQDIFSGKSFPSTPKKM